MTVEDDEIHQEPLVRLSITPEPDLEELAVILQVVGTVDTAPSTAPEYRRDNETLWGRSARSGARRAGQWPLQVRSWTGQRT
jgi:hypothetical protein